MSRMSYFYVLLLVKSAAAESQPQHPNGQVMNEGVAKILPIWTDVKRARNPYSWMAAEQGMRGRNPHSWMTQKKRSFRYAADMYRQPRNPYSWVYTMFDKRARNPYSWMNY